MKNVITATMSRARSLAMIRFLVLLGIVGFLPMFVHIQWLTGPIVNAVLLITVVIVGVREALLLALVPSSVALASGLLPTPLAPMVPFIMISNAILIWCFDVLRDHNYWLAIGVGALAKFIWLYSIVHLLMKYFLTDKLLESVAVMMSWPQLVTALIGGVIAWLFLRFLKFQI